MTPEERKQLVADFMAAKESRSQDVAVWMDMATRYQQLGANMNVAYCVRMAKGITPPALSTGHPPQMGTFGEGKAEPRYVAVEAVA